LPFRDRIVAQRDHAIARFSLDGDAHWRPLADTHELLRLVWFLDAHEAEVVALVDKWPLIELRGGECLPE
jgi:hypothetical protein